MLEHALSELMGKRNEWEGTASELLALLEGENLPPNPKGLSQRLKQPIAGLDIEFHRTKAARVLRIRKVTQVTPRVTQTVTQNPQTVTQAPHVDCHQCKHYQGADNPDYRARSCAVKQWHYPCYGWRPCSKYEAL